MHSFRLVVAIINQWVTKHRGKAQHPFLSAWDQFMIFLDASPLDCPSYLLCNHLQVTLRETACADVGSIGGPKKYKWGQCCLWMFMWDTQSPPSYMIFFTVCLLSLVELFFIFFFDGQVHESFHIVFHVLSVLPFFLAYSHSFFMRKSLVKELGNHQCTRVLGNHLGNVLRAEIGEIMSTKPRSRSHDRAGTPPTPVHRDQMEVAVLIEGKMAKVHIHPFHMNIVIICRASDLAVTYWSTGAKHATGFHYKDVRGMSLLNLVTDAKARAKLSELLDVASEGLISEAVDVTLLCQFAGVVSVRMVASLATDGARPAAFILTGLVVQGSPNIIHRLVEKWQFLMVEKMVQNVHRAWEKYASQINEERRSGASFQMVGHCILQARYVLSSSSPAHLQKLIAKAQTFEPTNIRSLIGKVVEVYHGTDAMSAVITQIAPEVPDYLCLDGEKVYELLSFFVSAASRNAKDCGVKLSVRQLAMTPNATCSLYALEFSIETSQVGLSHEMTAELRRRQEHETARTSSSENSAKMGQVHFELLQLGGHLVCADTAMGSHYVASLPLIPADMLLEDDASDFDDLKISANKRHLSIILYEPSAVYQTALSRMLLGAQHSLSIATSESDVFNMLQRSSDFQVVFLDVSSNSTPLSAFDPFRPHISIVLTCYSFSEEEIHSHTTNGFLLLVKPSSMSDMKNVLCELQNREDSRREQAESILKVRKLFSQHKTCAWERKEMIGTGSFGRVHRAVNLTTNGVMAVKCVEIPDTAQNGDRASISNDIINEIELISTLENEHIIHYLNSERTNDGVNIFMEYANGGSLKAQLAKNGRFTETRTKVYLKEILTGLSYLHDVAHVIHRDIKAANILISDGRCKLGDFQTATRCGPDQTVLGTRGTLRWMAPEVAKGEPHGPSCDVWSVGCLMLEMLTDAPPFSSTVPYSAMFYMSHLTELTDDAQVKFDEEGLSEHALSFLRACFHVEPSLRPSVKELMLMPFLNDDDLDLRRLHAFGRTRGPGSRRNTQRPGSPFPTGPVWPEPQHSPSNASVSHSHVANDSGTSSTTKIEESH